MSELNEEEDELKVKWLLVACMYAGGKRKVSPAPELREIGERL